MDKINFVGWKSQLIKQNGYLEKVLEGSTQVCFVSGEAGAGKTALVNVFVDNALQSNEPLLVCYCRIRA